MNNALNKLSLSQRRCLAFIGAKLFEGEEYLKKVASALTLITDEDSDEAQDSDLTRFPNQIATL